jgi:hypothetical protein
VILRRPATWRLPFHLTELCGRFSVAHAKNINAAQVPGLAVAHLAIDPLHHGTIPAYDDSSASNRASGLGANYPRQNSTTAAFPSIRRPSGAGDVSSKTVSSVKSAATHQRCAD